MVKSMISKAKGRPMLLTLASQWAYRKDGGTYHHFAMADSKILTQAYIQQRGMGTFTLNIQRHNDKRTTTYLIDFENMKQINKATGYARRLKVLNPG